MERCWVSHVYPAYPNGVQVSQQQGQPFRYDLRRSPCGACEAPHRDEIGGALNAEAAVDARQDFDPAVEVFMLESPVQTGIDKNRLKVAYNICHLNHRARAAHMEEVCKRVFDYFKIIASAAVTNCVAFPTSPPRWNFSNRTRPPSKRKKTSSLTKKYRLSAWP